MTVEIQLDQYLDENTLALIEGLGIKHCNLTQWIELIKETPTTDGASRFRAIYEPVQKVLKVTYEIYEGGNNFYFTDKQWRVIQAKLFGAESMEEAYITGRRSVRGLMQLALSEKEKRKRGVW